MNSGGHGLVRVLRETWGYVQKHGVRKTLKDFNQQDELSVGTLKGTDEFGNKYFENKENISGRARWVLYADYKNFTPASVPAEWHSWLHHVVDYTPVEVPPVKPIYKLPHLGVKLSNFGQNANYVPPGHLLRNMTDEVPGSNSATVDLKHYSSWQLSKDEQHNTEVPPRVEKETN